VRSDSQPALFSEPVPAEQSADHTETPEQESAVALPPAIRGWRLWARRLGVFLFVFASLLMGVALTILPWTARWSDNPYLVQHLMLRTFVLLGFVRGAVTGLGIINLWIGIFEGIRYREDEEPLVITK
jgi:hypothetical protein